MAKLEKGTRVELIGNATTGTKIKGTVMNFVPFGNHPTGKYEVHLDNGTVQHYTEAELTKIDS